LYRLALTPGIAKLSCNILFRLIALRCDADTDYCFRLVVGAETVGQFLRRAGVGVAWKSSKDWAKTFLLCGPQAQLMFFSTGRGEYMCAGSGGKGME
jgi:hypothetical protein